MSLRSASKGFQKQPAKELDRLERNVRHLITLDVLQALGVAFVSLAEGIDATTPAAPQPG